MELLPLAYFRIDCSHSVPGVLKPINDPTVLQMIHGRDAGTGGASHLELRSRTNR
jgi:hypothetical protein